MRWITLLILIFFTLSNDGFPQSFGGKSKTKFKSGKISVPRSAKSVSKSKKLTKVTTPKRGKSILGKIGDAATRGYGWQLGKEAARETIKGAKKILEKTTK